MLGESKGRENDIKDTDTSLALYEAKDFRVLSYTKTNKLITALYMVTDIMDKDEPIRKKLRDTGADILSDIFKINGHSNMPNRIHNRISEVLSFLDIASSVGIVSNMNSNILKKEFNELGKSILEFNSLNNQKWLSEFMKEDYAEDFSKPLQAKPNGQHSTRIGVQKGSTLMQALSDKIPDISKKNVRYDNANFQPDNRNKGGEVKNKRRDEIIAVIKDSAKNSVNFDGMTITDIRSIGHGTLAFCGEKTLQRELVSMVADGILSKAGSKRWSRYKLKA